MKLFHSIVLLSFLSFMSCENKVVTETKGPLNYESSQTYKTTSGAKFIVTQKPTDKATKFDIEIALDGFKKTNAGHTFKYQDPIDTIFLADLDKNNFDELYIVTKSTSNPYYANVIGMASNVGLSASPIVAPDHMYKTQNIKHFYKNYGGKNDIFVEDGVMYEYYPIRSMTNEYDQKIVAGKLQFELTIYDNNWSLGPSMQNFIKGR